MATSTITTDSGEKATRREIFALLPSDVVVAWDENTRHDEVTPERVAWVAADMEAKGQLQPITCKRLDDGRVKVLAGYTRLRAGLLIQERNPDFRILARLASVEDGEATFLLGIRENLFRNATTPVDNAHNMRQLIDGYGWTLRQVADFYDAGLNWVRDHLRLLNLPPAVQRKISSGELSLTAARNLSRLSGDEAADAIGDEPEAAEAAPRKVSRREVDEKARAAGHVIPRGVTDLRRLLADREDPVSVALRAYMAGEVDGDALAGVLDAAEAPVVQIPERPRKRAAAAPLAKRQAAAAAV